MEFEMDSDTMEHVESMHNVQDDANDNDNELCVEHTQTWLTQRLFLKLIDKQSSHGSLSNSDQSVVYPSKKDCIRLPIMTNNCNVIDSFTFKLKNCPTNLWFLFHQQNDVHFGQKLQQVEVFYFFYKHNNNTNYYHFGVCVHIIAFARIKEFEKYDAVLYLHVNGSSVNEQEHKTEKGWSADGAPPTSSWSHNKDEFGSGRDCEENVKVLFQLYQNAQIPLIPIFVSKDVLPSITLALATIASTTSLWRQVVEEKEEKDKHKLKRICKQYDVCGDILY
ncbi:hypothetical protein RFI_22519 [Reticulomyxa filosa]|uniref:Uncharacterized protein n=1 Tax=Reticulomyxa filosa TaxID=46433 RepID=X6MLX8_RETFI|nr:hypothetical protein RFI_22519 [Reticulomyxa filosa]|eukprot:ETO14849.1 hypothetical protein RFI_22519 [Reticulomyxa filosa]